MSNDSWQTKRIGELGRVVTGRTPPNAADEYFGGEVPFVTPSDMIGSRKVESPARRLSDVGTTALSRIVVPHGIAVSCIGWQMGKTVWLDRPFATNQQVNTVVPDPDIVDELFLYYSLSTRRDEIFRLGSGGSRTPIVNKRTFEDLLVALPSLEEQHRIAGVLGCLDDKIEQNRRTGRKLEELARVVFKAWFVDFEPVKAKAAGATSFPSMPLTTFATLPTLLVDSELGPVPEGWNVKPIGDVVTVRGGGTPSTKDETFWSGGTHCWATPKDLSALQHPILWSTERRITDAGVAKISSGVLPIDTVLLSSRAPVGYLAIAKVPTAVNQGFIAIECSGPLTPHYVLHWLQTNMEEIKGRASGTTFAEISKTAFRPIPAIVPPSRLVNAFEDEAKPMFDLITHLVAESAKLAALRDYLLPRLLSGKVRVRDAEAQLERAL